MEIKGIGISGEKNVMKKKRGNDCKFKDDMPEGMVLDRWPKFLDLQVKLPDPGEPAALVDMKTMCPRRHSWHSWRHSWHSWHSWRHSWHSWRQTNGQGNGQDHGQYTGDTRAAHGQYIGSAREQWRAWA